MKFFVATVVVFAFFGLTLARHSGERNQGKDCGAHSEWSECASSCPNTCENMGEVGSCDMKCNQKCVCKPGYIMDTHKRMCVLPTQCTRPKCGPNQVFSDCASSCPMSCQNMDTRVICDLACHFKCVCKPGYILDENTGSCVTPRQCRK